MEKVSQEPHLQQRPRVYLCPGLGLALGARLLKMQTGW